MSVFDAYARYYDLLNQEKDYASEAQYVASLIKKHGGETSALIDIGCGTGRHAELLAAAGFEVEGLDRAEAMIAQARLRNPDIEYHVGDLCDFNLGKRFGVVSALFHVISYLTEDEQLKDAFQHIRDHLEPGGLLIFDCWHGPAVLHQQPEVRIRRLGDKGTRVVRIAEPEMLPDKNRVNVNFQVFVEENGNWSEFTEEHPMRYLFRPEIEKLLADSGMKILQAEEWLTGREPDEDTWSVVYVARASGSE